MAEESEKRFKAIMDKLFHAPPPRNSIPASNSGNQSSRGVKRPNSAIYPFVTKEKSRGNLSISNSLVARGSGQAPLCRPWDRADLMKRLGTFKSMTWFAKPQVVNPVNCARRGWINVDADTIACESCGARLFFSTPSTWTQHQVEKAALVFGLKLDNGHKLLCPWIDNSCDEKLAFFPPTQAEVLVSEYKTRFSLLLNLLALPMVSSSAINHMKSPLLKSFLEDSSEGSSRSYYQAQKLISLCGWEPRLLPYTVDSKHQQTESQGVSNEHNSSLIVYTSGKEANICANNNSIASEKYDPNSVVLECKLCGASVGLWAFSTVPQPLELLRVVGYTKVGENNISANDSKESHIENRENTICTASTSATPSTERRSSLNMTIAGGPLPAKQNFKATISLPVIGRNLRARFSSDPDFRDRLYLKNVVAEGIENAENTISRTSLPPEDMSFPSVADGSSKDDKMPENAENNAITNIQVGVSGIAQTGECSMAAASGNLAITNEKNNEGNDLINFDADISDWPLIPVTAIECNAPEDSQDGNETVETAQPLNDDVQLTKIGENLSQLQRGESMEFDPIGQHRPFCPWIASASNSLPGWQQLLSALHRQNEFSCPSSAIDAPSSSLIEVDDPITSIRKLFTPPSAKRTKLVHESS